MFFLGSPLSRIVRVPFGSDLQPANERTIDNPRMTEISFFMKRLLLLYAFKLYVRIIRSSYMAMPEKLRMSSAGMRDVVEKLICIYALDRVGIVTILDQIEFDAVTIVFDFCADIKIDGGVIGIKKIQ